MNFKTFKIYFNQLKNTIYYWYLSLSGKSILVNAYFKWNCGKIKNFNWGDDINYYLFKELTGKELVSYTHLLYNRLHVKKNNILAIGSIIEYLTNSSSVIWGSGAIFGVAPLKEKPTKVLAVRGPLTRRYLINQGIDCPEVYGDPALLVKYVYKPNLKKKYRIGIIPHYIDLKSDPILNFQNSRDDKHVTLINIQEYSDWHNFINQINECEFIISSSLHGIIISDAYNIANLWVEFSDKVVGNGFKFKDYFASVKRNVDEPIVVKQKIDLEYLVSLKELYTPISIDLKPLIASCPFCDLNEILKSKYRYESRNFY